MLRNWLIDYSSETTQDKVDDVFNASDSDTVVPNSQDSPNRNSSVEGSALDSETPKMVSLIYYFLYIVTSTYVRARQSGKAAV